MKVTADTITEDQIRTLRVELLEESHNQFTIDTDACGMALTYPKNPDFQKEWEVMRQLGREHCADLWNSRYGDYPHKHCTHNAETHERMGWTCDMWPLGGPCCR